MHGDVFPRSQLRRGQVLLQPAEHANPSAAPTPVPTSSRSGAGRVYAAMAFEADVSIAALTRSSGTPSSFQNNRTVFVHCGCVRQAARIIAVQQLHIHSQSKLSAHPGQSDDNLMLHVTARFCQHPEYVVHGTFC